LARLIEGYLAEPTATWAVGAYGVIAEFQILPGDTVVRPDSRTVVTERGALAIAEVSTSEPLAYVVPSRRSGRWLHGLAFCRPEASARRGARRTLTELGPDVAALRPGDRGGVLFDLGTGAPQIEACVRVAADALLATLRRYCGQDVLFQSSPAMAAILEASPPRVFRSNAARIEVYQRIGSAAADPPTPPGPHTHVLPKLLQSGRSHAANEPITAGLVPCLYLFPESPVFDAMGRTVDFKPSAAAAFEALFAEWGDPRFRALSDRIDSAIARGNDPATIGRLTRHERQFVRARLRQWAMRGRLSGALLDPWQRSFDPTSREPCGAHHGH
jgi:hypothetical protein